MTDDARPIAPRRVAPIVELIAAGTLDAELAALVWLLVEARVPLVVAGASGMGPSRLRSALEELLPPATRLVTLRGGDEDFDWMPEAPELGWRRERTGAVASAAGANSAAAPRVDPGRTVLVADLEDRRDGGTWGERARVAIRALAVGYGMAATATGDRLEDVLGRLAATPVDAIDDELTRLGLVLLLKPGPSDLPRVAAAHYLRPVSRDVHGHVQRLPPAVLATWDPGTDGFEHFAWGVVSELAGRTGRTAVEFEREQARRASHLAGLVASARV